LGKAVSYWLLAFSQEIDVLLRAFLLGQEWGVDDLPYSRLYESANTPVMPIRIAATVVKINKSRIENFSRGFGFSKTASVPVIKI
jgi:hypothetical protein